MNRLSIWLKIKAGKYKNIQRVGQSPTVMRVRIP